MSDPPTPLPRMTPVQQISVYELPSMSLQAMKSLKIEGVVDFEWCLHGDKDKDEAEKAAKPGKAREDMLVYWTPEVANQPARATVINFPTRSVLRQMNLFNVSDVGQILRMVLRQLLKPSLV